MRLKCNPDVEEQVWQGVRANEQRNTIIVKHENIINEIQPILHEGYILYLVDVIRFRFQLIISSQ